MTEISELFQRDYIWRERSTVRIWTAGGGGVDGKWNAAINYR